MDLPGLEYVLVEYFSNCYVYALLIVLFHSGFVKFVRPILFFLLDHLCQLELHLNTWNYSLNFFKNKEINFLILLNSVMVLGAWLNILYVSTI